MKIKLVKLNNKSRKGMYYYIKEKKKRGKYFKKIPKIKKEHYIELYETAKEITKKGRKVNTKHTLKKIIQIRKTNTKISKKKLIEKMLTKKTTKKTKGLKQFITPKKTKITKKLEQLRGNKRKIISELMQKITKKSQLKRVVNNIDKFKKHIVYELEIKGIIDGQQGIKTLGTITHKGITYQEMINKYTEELKKGKIVILRDDPEYQNGNKDTFEEIRKKTKANYSQNNLRKYLENKVQTKGKIIQVNITISYVP